MAKRKRKSKKTEVAVVVVTAAAAAASIAAAAWLIDREAGRAELRNALGLLQQRAESLHPTDQAHLRRNLRKMRSDSSAAVQDGVS